MKIGIVLISTFVGQVLLGLLACIVIAFGLGYIASSTGQYCSDESWSMLFGSVCYTVLVVAVTLIVRWAFSC